MVSLYIKPDTLCQGLPALGAAQQRAGRLPIIGDGLTGVVRRQLDQRNTTIISAICRNSRRRCRFSNDRCCLGRSNPYRTSEASRRSGDAAKFEEIVRLKLNRHAASYYRQ